MKIILIILIILIIIYFYLNFKKNIETFTDKINIPDNLYDRQMVDIYDIVWNNPIFYKNIRLEQDYFKKNKKILDVGCALGYSTDYYRNLGMNVIGVDKSKEMLNRASMINPKNEYIRGDVVNHDLFKNNKFDIINFGLMTIHMNSSDNLNNIIKNCKKWLKKDGYLIIDFIENDRLILFPQNYSQFYNDDKGNRHFFTYFKGFLHDSWFMKINEDKSQYDLLEKITLENGKNRIKSTRLYIPKVNELIGIIENNGFKLEDVLEISGHSGNKIYCFKNTF
jgi:SAM-dependent methyltransferase